jgi:hypothetical protein
MIRTFAFVVCGILVCTALRADADDPIRAKLNGEKALYDATVADLSAQVLAWFEGREALARNAGDRKLVLKIQDEKKSFETTGELPRIRPGFPPGINNKEQSARGKMTLAYRNAVQEYTRAVNDIQAAAVEKELEEFKGKASFRVPPNPHVNKQLLTNPGCEDVLVAGKIPGWSEVRGEWSPFASVNVPAHEGKVYFSARSSPAGELAQDVSLESLAEMVDEGKLRITFTGEVRSFEQNPPDATQIIIECRDAKNEKVLVDYPSARIESVTGWKTVSHTAVVPKETRNLRVRLITSRSSRGNITDAYFDNLSLKAAPKE